MSNEKRFGADRKIELQESAIIIARTAHTYSDARERETFLNDIRLAFDALRCEGIDEMAKAMVSEDRVLAIRGESKFRKAEALLNATKRAPAVIREIEAEVAKGKEPEEKPGILRRILGAVSDPDDTVESDPALGMGVVHPNEAESK